MTEAKEKEIKAIKEFVNIILDSYDDRHSSYDDRTVILTDHRNVSKPLKSIGILTEDGEFDIDKISEYADIFALYGITSEHHLFYYKGILVYI